jgi:uncharacterized protein involved in exopolysaccharide biosynthesis
MATQPMTELPRTAGEPPPLGRLGVLESLRRQWYFALLPVLLFVGAAVAIGMTREPEYESEARLNVGGLNLTRQSIEGYTAAVTQLAVAYARSVDAERIVKRVGRETGLRPPDVSERVSATPIQGSSVIRVFATGPSADEAQRVADATADELVDYAIDLNSGRSTSERLLERFTAASRKLRRARAAQANARPRDRQRFETRVDIAKLQKDTAGFLYSQSQAGQATTELVQKLAPAAPATSDRADVLKDLVAGGLIAGLLVGVGLAVARANAIARRRLGRF